MPILARSVLDGRARSVPFHEMNTRIQVEHRSPSRSPGSIWCATDPMRPGKSSADAEEHSADRACHRVPHQRRGPVTLPRRRTDHGIPCAGWVRVRVIPACMSSTWSAHYDSLLAKLIAFGIRAPSPSRACGGLSASWWSRASRPISFPATSPRCPAFVAASRHRLVDQIFPSPRAAPVAVASLVDWSARAKLPINSGFLDPLRRSSNLNAYGREATAVPALRGPSVPRRGRCFSVALR